MTTFLPRHRALLVLVVASWVPASHASAPTADDVGKLATFLGVRAPDLTVEPASSAWPGDRIARYRCTWRRAGAERLAFVELHRRRRFVVSALFSRLPVSDHAFLEEARLRQAAERFALAHYPGWDAQRRLALKDQREHPPIATFAWRQRDGESWTGASVSVVVNRRTAVITNYSCFVPRPDAPRPRIDRAAAVRRARQAAEVATHATGWSVAEAALVLSSITKEDEGPVWTIRLRRRADGGEADYLVAIDAVDGEVLRHAG